MNSREKLIKTINLPSAFQLKPLLAREDGKFQYPCSSATVGYSKLDAKSILAGDVIWAILPYVPYQYGN